MKKLFLIIMVFSVLILGSNSAWSQNSPEEKIYGSALKQLYMHQSGIKVLGVKDYEKIRSSLPSYKRDTVTVIISVVDNARQHESRVRSLGIQKFSIGRKIIWAEVPLNLFHLLVEEPWVRYVEPYVPPHPMEFPDRQGTNHMLQQQGITTEGFARVNATEYHQNGFRGQGVRIGIIDLEYGRLQDALNNNEVGNINGQFVCDISGCRQDNVETQADTQNGNVHGTACFEIIYDFASDAKYYLVRLGTGSLMDAVETLINENVDIISMSVGWAPWAGPLNGKDRWELNDAVEFAKSRGVLFVTAAGNSRKQIYYHTYTDNDRNGYHEFTQGIQGFFKDENLDVTLEGNKTYIIGLCWDEWDLNDPTNPISKDDYKLWICPLRTLASPPDNTCAQSYQAQNGDDLPVDTIEYTPAWTGHYRIWVERVNPYGNEKKIKVFIAWEPKSFEHPTYSSSITPPADTQNGIVVGAADPGGLFGWGADEQHGYSSEGPTFDARYKPDVMNYARVSSFGYGYRWQGTSAATPHVAGIASIMLSMNPNLTVNQLMSETRSNATPKGNGHPNSQYGWGIARLPLIGDPVVEIFDPTISSPSNVLADKDNEKINIEVSTKSQAGDFIGGLNQHNFDIAVGGNQADILSLLQVSESYLINILLPRKSEGEYDLSVNVNKDQKSGSSMESNAIIYASSATRNVDTALVIDRSGSMSGDPILNAKNAAGLFVDLMSNGDQVGIVSYSSSSRIDLSLTQIASTTGQTVFSDDMESSTSNWTADQTWALIDSEYHSANHSWTDSPGGSYSNYANTSLTMTGDIDLSALSNPALSFWTKHDLESGYDYGRVEISIDGGNTWAELVNYTGSSNWTEKQISLSSYSNQQVRIRFRLTSDYSVTRDGWYIDDLVIKEANIKDIAKSAIDGISASGMTSIGAGLRDAYNELTTKGLATHPWSVVLLTDGQENTSPYVSDVLPDILATKIKVFTIGLGNVDESLLQDIAQQTGGQYFYTPTDQDLQSIYNTISGYVLEREDLYREEAQVSQGETVTRTLYVDSSVTEAVFSISWTSSNNNLELTLMTPSGREINQNTIDPDVEYVEGNTYTYYRISTPESGTWTMVIAGQSITTSLASFRQKALSMGITEVREDLAEKEKMQQLDTYQQEPTETFVINVQAVTDVTMTVYFDSPRYSKGNTIKLMVALLDMQPITDVDIVAEVRYPEGTTTDLTNFRDDGVEGDNVAVDGIHTAVFTSASQIGTYTFVITATGASNFGDGFQRIKEVSTTVVDAEDQDGDGMPDWWEISFAVEGRGGLDPTTNDSQEDPDGDGLLNIDEFIYGTHPFMMDTDGDHLKDGEEVNPYNTNPAMADTDGGGELDGSEIANGRDPLDPNDDVVSVEAEIQLNLGWNLISISLQPENTSIDNVLNPISGKYSSVWAFINNSWKIYDPANPGASDLTAIEAAWGYWLNMNESGTLTISGETPINSIELRSGWNLVGYNSSTAQPVADALVSIDGKYTLVWAFSGNAWELYDQANPGFSDLAMMETGHGYWIKTTEACTWTLP